MVVAVSENSGAAKDADIESVRSGLVVQGTPLYDCNQLLNSSKLMVPS